MPDPMNQTLGGVTEADLQRKDADAQPIDLDTPALRKALAEAKQKLDAMKRPDTVALLAGAVAEGEDVARFFAFAHLPEHLQAVSRPFAELAARLVSTLPACRQRTVALEMLLTSKDAAVRAAIPR